jgi:hypothetical protein
VTSQEVVKISKEERKKKNGPKSITKSEKPDVSSFGLNTGMNAKVKQTLIHSDGNEQPCFIVGPLNFDQTQFTLMGLIPEFIHVAPIVFMDFSMANLTFQSSGVSVHTPNETR